MKEQSYVAHELPSLSFCRRRDWTNNQTTMEFKEDDEKPEYKCELCHDTGVIDFFESPIGEEGINAPVGERTCDCQVEEDETDD